MNPTNPLPDPLHLAVVTGSTREGRFGPTVARWFSAEAERHPSFTVADVDLAEIELPTALPRHRTDAQRHYLGELDRADAIVVVTPEYNHGYPASLKQAIDLAKAEWRHKPIGIVSYGARSGGIRATEQLRQVFPELEAMTIRESVALPNVWHLFDPDGQPRETDGLASAARAMLDELAWWAEALRAARRVDELVAMSS
jgi:NAD(P)H-dependent FMN reductase